MHLPARQVFILHYITSLPQGHLLLGGWVWLLCPPGHDHVITFVRKRWTLFLVWCSAAMAERFWVHCAPKVFISTDNNLSKGGDGDLKLNSHCLLLKSNVRLNYMEGMLISSCQRLWISSSHFWNDASQSSVTATPRSKRQKERNLFIFFHTIKDCYF